jgi:hypothetical protein
MKKSNFIPTYRWKFQHKNRACEFRENREKEMKLHTLVPLEMRVWAKVGRNWSLVERIERKQKGRKTKFLELGGQHSLKRASCSYGEILIGLILGTAQQIQGLKTNFLH